ncbi:hypothetical protein [Actinomyces trachealis]|uniref:hypothetical protein n=1 Tax=Actinomyces trachealis TaxID=2763540 RepID=UPI001892B0F2|nr:hypothetical protein [Actinomyces trachealis]
MTSKQKRLVVAIVAVVVLLIGSFAAAITWSATHRMTEETSTPPAVPLSTTSSTAAPTPSVAPTPTQLDGYSEEFQATAEQQDLARKVVEEWVAWSEQESASDRTARLADILTSDAASTAPMWSELYGDIEGASVTVDDVGDALAASNDGETFEVGVVVTWTLHIPHADGSEVVSPSTGTWLVQMAVDSTTEQATAVTEPRV